MLVLEDSPAGLAAAKAAGAFAVGVPHEHSPAEDCRRRPVVPRLDDPALLLLIESGTTTHRKTTGQCLSPTSGSRPDDRSNFVSNFPSVKNY